MPKLINSSRRRIEISPLTEDGFRSFGSVIQYPSSRSKDALPANQGTALKIPSICLSVNSYHLAPSKREAAATTNLFICYPRELRREADTAEIFDVQILERHNYTTQTFVPLGLDSGKAAAACYLVIVCPSLPCFTSSVARSESGADKPLFGELKPGSMDSLNLREAPDLDGLKAFIAHGNQAITYAAGTWHAPMVVLGKEPVQFVVFQFTNGVAEEDCEEALIQPKKEKGCGIEIALPHGSASKL